MHGDSRARLHGPLFQGGGESLVQRFLGEIEIAQEPD